jgi:signal transduction histidine kinase
VSAVPALENTLVDELSGLARAYSESQLFVSLLAHELRTRLRVTERALADPADDGREAALENTRNAQALLETLLELERGRTGESADADAAMRTVLEDLGEDADRVGVVGSLPTIPLPRGLLETVLRNLVRNALEARADRVEIFARPDRTICVRDDGPGVPPRKAARIFGAYSGKFGGAGLGLTLCREILRRRGGELWLELPSTFCFHVG